MLLEEEIYIQKVKINFQKPTVIEWPRETQRKRDIYESDCFYKGYEYSCTVSFDSTNRETVSTYNHKNYNFLDCDWLKKLPFFTNSLVKLWSDSLLSDSSISQSHSKL